MDQNGVDALQIGKLDQFLQRRNIAHIAWLLEIGLAPTGIALLFRDGTFPLHNRKGRIQSGRM
jgi:hypothetical protein